MLADCASAIQNATSVSVSENVIAFCDAFGEVYMAASLRTPSFVLGREEGVPVQRYVGPTKKPPSAPWWDGRTVAERVMRVSNGTYVFERLDVTKGGEGGTVALLVSLSDVAAAFQSRLCARWQWARFTALLALLRASSLLGART